MDKNQRIKLAVKWLITNGVAKNQEGLGQILGYKSKSAFSQVLNGKVALPNDFIDRICALSEKINRNWLITGEGNITDKNEDVMNELRKENEQLKNKVALYEAILEKITGISEAPNKQVV